MPLSDGDHGPDDHLIPCERCRTPVLAYASTYSAGDRWYALCPHCRAVLQEITDHAAQGGEVCLVGEGTRRISVPAEDAPDAAEDWAPWTAE